jgi:uncharacterized protein (TIGR03000 family)
MQIFVPADAKLFINGREMKSTGRVRTFSSEPLVEGVAYMYKVRAEMIRDGRTITENETVQLQPGRITQLTFDFAAAPTASAKDVAALGPKTTLKLHVPEDAKVILSGNDTRSIGRVREFSTDALAANQDWADYEVRVEVLRNGRKIVKDHTIHLTAGATRELKFDFNEEEDVTVADVRR